MTAQLYLQQRNIKTNKGRIIKGNIFDKRRSQYLTTIAASFSWMSGIHSIWTSKPSRWATSLNRMSRACKIAAWVWEGGLQNILCRGITCSSGCDNLLLDMIFMLRHTPHTCHCFTLLTELLSTVPSRFSTGNHAQSSFIMDTGYRKLVRVSKHE